MAPWARGVSFGGTTPTKGLYMRIDAKPHAAIAAQLGSSAAISWNVRSPSGHQKECSIATPRCTFACVCGLHELAKLTVPIFPVALPASSSCATALTANNAAKNAMSCFMTPPARIGLQTLQVEPLAIAAPGARQILLGFARFRRHTLALECRLQAIQRPGIIRRARQALPERITGALRIALQHQDRAQRPPQRVVSIGRRHVGQRYLDGKTAFWWQQFRMKVVSGWGDARPQHIGRDESDIR